MDITLQKLLFKNKCKKTFHVPGIAICVITQDNIRYVLIVHFELSARVLV